ncbi:MAG: hypothetical protein ND807_13370 [Vicinamibacterales bacterium]|nr:hypothetical protein [Vicinamibacterales bacterium]
MINATWHKQHRMPKGATPQQRLRWHVAHAKVCGCRNLTASTLRKLRQSAQKYEADRRG